MKAHTPTTTSSCDTHSVLVPRRCGSMPYYERTVQSHTSTTVGHRGATECHHVDNGMGHYGGRGVLASRMRQLPSCGRSPIIRSSATAGIGAPAVAWRSPLAERCATLVLCEQYSCGISVVHTCITQSALCHSSAVCPCVCVCAHGGAITFIPYHIWWWHD